jgi:hypothetical protein
MTIPISLVKGLPQQVEGRPGHESVRRLKSIVMANEKGGVFCLDVKPCHSSITY